MPPKQKLSLQSKAPQFDALTLAMSDDDDDFQNPSHAISLTQNIILSSLQKSSNKTSSQPQKPPTVARSSKKPKRSIRVGKENIRTTAVLDSKRTTESENCCVSSVDTISMEPSKDCSSRVERDCLGDCVSAEPHGEIGFQSEDGSLSNPIESRLIVSSTKDSLSGVNNCCSDEHGLEDLEDGFSAGSDEIKGDSSEKDYFLASIESRVFETNENCSSSAECGKQKGFEMEKGYLSNSIESRLLGLKTGYNSSVHDLQLDETSLTDFEPGTQLNVLMELCSEVVEESNSNGVEFEEEEEEEEEENGFDDGLVKCPLCGIDISDLSEELRLVHSNECLDRAEIQKVVPLSADSKPGSSGQVGDTSPVLEWLRSLGLSKYEEAFVKEEIDWETLHWLTEEDLFSIGITTLGPRKKIVYALNEVRKGNKHADGAHADASKVSSDESKKLPGNKLITEYFPGSFVVDRNRNCPPSKAQCVVERSNKGSGQRSVALRNHVRNTKLRDIPSWCCVPGTPFRVDAFRYLRGDCTHWFLSHFHIDHYQGLTKSFCHGKIYCSSITARLVNMKIGVPWDRLQVLPLNQKISISGVDVTCLDANHCPGSVIILFEPPNCKAVLHTGDFRFSEEMANISILQSCPVQTLILDTTYCNPQYDFPKQEAVIQFVIEAIQAEAFNPKTLFLIGSYTIGKERLFLEVARCLRKKVYVGAAKLHLLECLGLPKEDMQWFTLNEQESHIHVVPMWTIASFKRMKHISNQYSNRFNLIVAFSPTGWTFGKGKKKSPGRRLKQGTIIRYEVPYSEHSSFTELRDFVKFLSPENIIPSVNNDGPESADAMIALLTS